MTDDADHKKPKGFEPPPWEREAFEELARRRAVAEAETEGAPTSADPEAPREDAPVQAGGEAPAGNEAPPARAEAPAATNEGADADGRVADAMLFELSGQEGPTMAPLRRAGKVVAGLMAAIGLAIVVLAVSMAVQAAGAEADRGVAGVGAAIIAVFGLLTLGTAVWMWVRANRSQGS